MLTNPKPHTRVRLHYRPSVRAITPHGELGEVLIPGRGKPRSHLILLDSGRKVIVPAGNLVREEP